MALKFEITGDNSNLLNSLNGARDGVRRVARDIEDSGLSIEEMFTRVGQAASVAFSLSQAKSFVNKVVEVRSYFQDIQSTMEVFLGNQQKAAEFTQQLKDYAYYNMYDFSQLSSASTQMIAYGNSVDTVIPRLDQLSNIASGTKAELMDLVNLYNRAKNLGSIGSEGLDSWATRGLVVKDVLKQMGVEVDEAKVTFEQLNMVLDHVTAEGGMFHNLMLNQMQNISAEQGQLQDNLDAMYNEIGEKYQEYITGAIKAEGWLVDHYKEIGSVILGLTAAYGEYRAALMVTKAIENTMAKQANGIEKTRQEELGSIYKQYSDNSDIMAIGQEAVAEEMNTAAILQNTKSREGNVTAIDEQIAALERKMLAEIAEYDKIMESAQAAIDAAATKEQAADKEIEVLQQQVDTAREYLEMCNQDVEAANQSGDAQEIETAKRYYNIAATEAENAEKALATAQTNRETAASAKLAAEKNLETAANRRVATQEKLTTMQKAVSTAQTKAQTAATGLWIAMMNGAKKALNGLKVAMASNPFGVALAAVTTLISLLPLFSEETSEASAEVERFGESAVKQKRSLETLMAVVENTSSDSKVHKDAIEDLCKIYDEYGFKVDDSIDKLDQLRAMHDLVTDAIHREGEERQKANLLATYEEALGEATSNMRNALQKAFDNAEWDGSGTFDDWDAEEYKEMSKELTAIVGGIIQSEGDALATLTGEELEQKIGEVNERIKKAYADMGLALSKEFIKEGSDGLTYTIDASVDVDAIQIMRDYVVATHAVTEGRNKLVESWNKAKPSVKEEAKEVDYSTMSIEALAKAASKANDGMSDLGNKTASPEVDKTSIDDAGAAARAAKDKISLLNGLTTKPIIDSSSIGAAIGQTNVLLSNMWQIHEINGGRPMMNMGLGFNFMGQKPMFAKADEQLLAQKELDNRIKKANTQKSVDDLLKEVGAAMDKAVFDSPEYKRLEVLKNRLEAKSRKGSKKTDKNSEADKISSELDKLESMQESSSLDRERTAKDLETRVYNATLEAKEDGAEKVRLLQEQQDKEELEAIERQKEDAIKKYIEEEKKIFEQQEKIKKLKNPKYKEAKFDESTVDTSKISEQYNKLISLKKESQEGERHRLNLQSMREYLREYGSELEQELTITKDYQEQIEKARAQGNHGLAMSLEKKMQEELSNMRLANLRNSPEYVRAFENLGNISNETLKALIKNFEDAKNAAAKSLDPHLLKEYTSTLQQMYDELDSRNPFESLTTALKELSKAQEKVNTAQEIYDTVKSGKVVINQNTGKAYTEADASRLLAEAKDNEAKAYTRLIKATESCAQNLNSFADTLKNLGEMVGGKLGESLNALGGVLGSVGGAFDNIKSINVNATGIEKYAGQFSAVVGTVSAMVEMNRQLDKLLPNTESLYEHYATKQRELNEKRMRFVELEIAQLEERLNSESWFYENGLTQLKRNAELNAEYAKAYGEIAAAPQEVYKDASSGFAKWAPAIIGAIVGIVAGIFTFGAGAGPGAVLGAALGTAIGGTVVGAALGSTVVAAIGTAIFSGVGAALGNAVRAGVDGITYKDNQTAAINNMRVQTRKKGFFRSEKTQDLQSWVKENWGQELFEEIKGVQLIDPEVAKKILEKGPTLVGETRETIEQLLGYSEKIRKFVDQVHEYVSEALSPLVENLTDALWEWLSNGEDVMDKFREYAGDTFKKIAQDALKAMITKNIFDPFQEQLDNLTIAYSTGQIDEASYVAGVAEFAKRAQASIETQLPVLQNTAQIMQIAMENAGIDIAGKDSEYKQEASSKGFQAMGQDTGEELNGRFTALQISNDTIAEQAIQMHSQMIAMTEIQTSSNNCLIEIRNMMIIANGHLEDTAKYSKKMYLEFGEKLDSMIDNTKNL